MVSVSFIVASRNNEHEITETVNQILDAVIKVPITDFEVILVDNNSTDKTGKIMNSLSETHYGVRHIKESKVGVSFAFNSGVSVSSKEFSLPLPGHNMYPSESIVDVINRIENETIILGYRVSKLNSRPILKTITSFIFIQICNFIFKLNVKDINGLVVFPTQFLQKNMISNAGHGHAVIPLVRAHRSGIRIIQTPVQIFTNHKKRKGATLAWHYPKVKNVYSAIRSIYWLIKEPSN